MSAWVGSFVVTKNGAPSSYLWSSWHCPGAFGHWPSGFPPGGVGAVDIAYEDGDCEDPLMARFAESALVACRN